MAQVPPLRTYLISALVFFGLFSIFPNRAQVNVFTTGESRPTGGTRVTFELPAHMPVHDVGYQRLVARPKANPEAFVGAVGSAVPRAFFLFDYAAWSRDGRRLAGLLLHSSGRRTLALHVLGSSEYQDLDVEAEIPIAWLAGDRDVLFLRHGKLMTVELATRRAREVVVPAGSGGGRASDWIAAFDLSQDRKTLFVLRSRVHGEIWQITTP